MMDVVAEHKSQWELLSLQEEDHAAALEEVRRAVAERPHLFLPGKYAPATARMMTQDVRQMIDKIEQGEVRPQAAVNFIMDVELSLLESGVDQAVKTDVVEIQHILGRLTEQTAAHRKLLRGISV